MYKPSFENQSKKAEAPSDLKALFKINAGLYELQKSKQQAQGAPVGTVAEQIQKQGLEAISEPNPPEEAVEQSGVMQAVPDTAMGKTAMQAGLGAQITAAEQAKQQQAAMQAAMQMAASQQAPQPMARGGIAALSANNMRFQRGGVVGFNGESESAVKKAFLATPGATGSLAMYERGGGPERDAAEEAATEALRRQEQYAQAVNRVGRKQVSNDPEIQSLMQRVRDTGGSDAQAREKIERLTRERYGSAFDGKAPVDMGDLGIGALSGVRAMPAQLPPPSPAPVKKPAAAQAGGGGEGGAAGANNPPSVATPRPGKGLAALAPIEKDKVEAEKQAALKAAQEQQVTVAKTPQQLRAEQEAEAKATGVDLYGQSAKERTAALEKEFANQEAARAEANKSRGMDNLITMLTSSGGAPSLFSGLAKGTQAYKAAEKQQKADDIIWGGKKLEFMQKIGEQKDLLNERNKQMMLGNISKAQQLAEAERLGKNQILQQVANIYEKSMTTQGQAAIHEATNATQVLIAKIKHADEAANRKAMQEGRDFSAIEGRISQNAQTSSNIIKQMQKSFADQYSAIQAAEALGMKFGTPEAQKQYAEAKIKHKAEIAAEMKRAADENYKLEMYQWNKAGKAMGQPKPEDPSAKFNQLATESDFKYLGEKSK